MTRIDSVDSNGMPKIGFGLWKIDKAVCADVVYQAIEAGYRHFDSASDYGNEKEVGEGIARALADRLCTREELWVTSKLWNTFHAQEHVLPALQKTLQDLQLEYLDLYLVHFPIALKYVDFDTRYPPEWFYDPESNEPRMELARVPLHETWAAMEQTVGRGTQKIGVCNYNSGLLHDLMTYADIKPATLQVESHPYNVQPQLLRLCQQYAIEMTAFSPLGSLSYVELSMAESGDSLLHHELIKLIATDVEKTAAQVLLRWAVQRGTSIIPKSTNPQRMRENLDIFDFSLTDSHMQQISELNQNRRFNDPGVFCEAAFNTFHPIYD